MKNYVVNVSSHLNVRSNPQTSAALKDTLNKGDIVQHKGQRQDSFVYIFYGKEKTGWVAERYLINEKEKIFKEPPKPSLLEKPPWLISIEKVAGSVEEIPGAGTHPWIASAFDLTTSRGENFDDSLHGWCAAAANKVLIDNGFPGTGSLRADSFIHYGVEAPLAFGAIAVFAFPKNRHVTFISNPVPFMGKLGLYSSGVGGNQRNKIKSSNYLLQNLIALRWPPTV